MNNPALPEAQKQAILAYMEAEAISPEAVGRIRDSFKIVEQIHAMPVANPLGTQYFSAAPFLFGRDRVMKFSAKPCQVVPPTDIPNPPADNYLTDVLIQTMQRHGDLQFDFMVQVRGADADLGVENASSLWDEAKYPFVPVPRSRFTRHSRMSTMRSTGRIAKSWPSRPGIPWPRISRSAASTGCAKPCIRRRRNIVCHATIKVRTDNQDEKVIAGLAPPVRVCAGRVVRRSE